MTRLLLWFARIVPRPAGPVLLASGLIAVGLIVLPGMAGPSMATVLGRTRWISYAPTHYYPAEHPPVMPSVESITTDLTTLRAAGFDGLITYGADVEGIPDVAQSLGFRAMLIGIWNPWSHIERDSLLRAVNRHRGLIAGIIVGNEGILSGRYSVDALCASMVQIGKETGKPVSTTEPVDWILGEPKLAECSDFVTVNAHPYFSHHRAPDDAVRWTLDAWVAIRRRYPGKPTLFKEVGLPSGPSGELTEEGQKEYYLRLMRTPVRFSFFEAFDADPRFKEGEVEQCWGLWKTDRTPKKIVSALKWSAKR